jgi:universal stress protein E
MSHSPAIETNAKRLTGKCVLFAITSPDGISRCALRKAARLAGALGTELELFYRGFDPDILHSLHLDPHGAEEGIRDFMDRQRQQMRSLAEELREPGLVVHSRVEWDSRPVEGIVREVLHRKPALLIVEAFRDNRAERLLFESTLHKLIEKCPCPLLLIRTAYPYSVHPRIVAAIDPMHAHDKPAALDGAIVTAASALSEALGGELHLFHARVPWAIASHQSRAFRWVPDVAKDDNQVDYEHIVLARVTDVARRHEVANLHTHLVDGDVTACLPSFLSADPVDIVAMGALSRSFLERLLIGNTARRLFDALDCDVLVVKPPGFRTPVTLPESVPSPHPSRKEGDLS